VKKELYEKIKGSLPENLKKDIEKYGLESFEFEILDSAQSQEELDRKQAEYINKYNSLEPLGYNLPEDIYKKKEIMIESKKKYISTWRNKWITSQASTIDDFISTFEALAKQFRQWKEWGIKLHDDGAVGDDYATFITDDMDVAIKAGFTFYSGDDRETEYLTTLTGEEIKVPKEKLLRQEESKN